MGGKRATNRHGMCLERGEEEGRGQAGAEEAAAVGTVVNHVQNSRGCRHARGDRLH